MTDRIGALGGSLQVESSPGCGTRVIAKIHRQTERASPSTNTHLARYGKERGVAGVL
jgi:hypothetical protein